MLQYDDFLENPPRDYILIKLNNECPFFHEKIYVKDGTSRTETNYHLANGYNSNYINYEMPDNGISAEVSGPIRFEVNGKYDCPVYIVNAGKESLEYKIRSGAYTMSLAPGMITAIYSEELAKAEEEAYIEKLEEENFRPGIAQFKAKRILGAQLKRGKGGTV